MNKEDLKVGMVIVNSKNIDDIRIVIVVNEKNYFYTSLLGERESCGLYSNLNHFNFVKNYSKSKPHTELKYTEQPAFETNEFKVGDKIKVYDGLDVFEETVKAYISEEFIEVEDGLEYSFKQCRLLLPTKPREFWVLINYSGKASYVTEKLEELAEYENHSIVKVREVLED